MITNTLQLQFTAYAIKSDTDKEYILFSITSSKLTGIPLPGRDVWSSLQIKYIP